MPRKQEPKRNPALEALGCTPGITYIHLHTETVYDLLSLRSVLSERAYNALTSAVLTYYMTGTEPVLTRNASVHWPRFKYAIDTTRDAVLRQNPQLATDQGAPTGDSTGTPIGDTTGAPTGLPVSDQSSPSTPSPTPSSTASASSSPSPTADRGGGCPQSLDEVRKYCTTEGLYDIDVEGFYRAYEENGWTDKDGQPIRNWRSVCRAWDSNAKAKRAQSGAGRTGSGSGWRDGDVGEYADL